MDFSLTDDQESLRGLAADIFGGRATQSRVEEVEATDERFDRDLWLEIAKAGLVGVALPEEHGGLGLGVVDLAVVCEELGRVVAPVPLVWTACAAMTVATHGSTDQQQRWLPGVVSGDVVLTTAVPLVAAGVRLDGDRVTGVLHGVPYAHVAAAVLVPVGDRVYAIDPAGEGVTMELGTATSREVHGVLHLDGAVAEPVGGDGAAAYLWQRTVVALAAVTAGGTAAALRLAADYTSQRHQFGKPLSTFQGVALKAADGYIDNVAIRSTMQQAAWRLDRGEDATAQVLTAAWWAAEGGQHCVHITQHLHGGMGADTTYPVHRYFLWGKQIEQMLGGASALLAQLGEVVPDVPGDALNLS